MLLPVPGPDAHSCPGFSRLLALPINLILPLAELLELYGSSRHCLWSKLLLALLLEAPPLVFAAGGALGGLGDSDAEGRASTGGQLAAGRV